MSRKQPSPNREVSKLRAFYGGNILSPRFVVRRATEHDANAIAGLACDLGYPADTDTMRGRIRAVSESLVDSLFVAADSSAIPVGWLHAHSAQLIESGFRVEILGSLSHRHL